MLACCRIEMTHVKLYSHRLIALKQLFILAYRDSDIQRAAQYEYVHNVWNMSTLRGKRVENVLHLNERKGSFV